MMSYKAEETIFHYNSDFSGYVVVTKNKKQFQIPGQDILEFVAYCYVQPEKIKKTEETNYKDLLTQS